MTFPYISAINIIPASGEGTCDTVLWNGTQPGGTSQRQNSFRNPGMRADVLYSLDKLQADLPNCQTVALVVQWLGNSTDVATCKIYPSSTFIGGTVNEAVSGAPWRVSDVTLGTSGLIPITRPNGVNSSYGGTYSDQSVVRCLQEIKARGLKAALYLQMNMDVTGKPWRGTVGLASDVSSAATTAANNFLGSATPAQFTRDVPNKTVHYSGSVLDFTYRRFVLHYANLAAVAGGVSLFVIGSELVRLEGIRGPAWTRAGTVDGGGKAVWDYPFVEGLKTLLNDVRGVFDGVGLTKNVAARQNCITYSADWSSWMGDQPVGVAGIFPHLDTLYAHPHNDFVSFDNYLPLSDVTTGDGGLDYRNWRAAPPALSSWPPVSSSLSSIGFNLDGPPDIHDMRYLKANIEGGEKFNWFYGNYTQSNTFDPNGTGMMVTAPQGDRLTQTRQPYFAGQELLAFKRLRWWWENTHRAVYDDGLGGGYLPHGPVTQWIPRSKSIIFMEYGFPSEDKCTNEQNLFFDTGSVAGGTPFWCELKPGTTNIPKEDPTLQANALRAFYEYWVTDGHNQTVSGVPMIATDLIFDWAWDARTFPEFPLRLDQWADGVNWRYGHWIQGKFGLTIPQPDASPSFDMPVTTFPQLPGQAWPKRRSPKFDTRVVTHVSGRQVAAGRFANPLYEFGLSFAILANSTRRGQSAFSHSLQMLQGLYEQCRGREKTFLYVHPEDSVAVGQELARVVGSTTNFIFARNVFASSIIVSWVTSVETVYLNGVAQPGTAWTLIEPNILVMSTPVASGITVSADFHFGFVCRFDEDKIDFNDIYDGISELQSLNFTQSRT